MSFLSVSPSTIMFLHVFIFVISFIITTVILLKSTIALTVSFDMLEADFYNLRDLRGSGGIQRDATLY